MPRANNASQGRRFAAILLIALASAVGWVAWATRDQGRIFRGVSMAGINVGGMTREAARLAVRARAADLAREKLTLRTGEREWVLPGAALGVARDPDAAARQAYAMGRRGWLGRRAIERLRLRQRGIDLPFPARLDERRARGALGEIARRLEAGPRDATAELVGGKVVLVPEVPGGHLDVERSLALLRARVESGDRRPLDLAAEVRAPRVRASDLQGVDGVIAEFSTSLGGSSRNRVHNVATAAHALDGCVILPGETFSYNRVVGPRTKEAGYRTAPVLQNGELVPGTGGGACQVSSTLYNVALLSNMTVTRRSHHSRPVHYVRAGRDATVVYGALDLVFRSTSGSAVVIRSQVARGRLWIKALGRTPAPAVRIETASRAMAMPPAVERLDPALAPGERAIEHKAQRGLRVTVTRIVGEGAEARREVVSNDVYRPQAAVIRVGPRPVPPEETEPAPPAETPSSSPEATTPTPEKSPKITE